MKTTAGWYVLDDERSFAIGPCEGSALIPDTCGMLSLELVG